MGGFSKGAIFTKSAPSRTTAVEAWKARQAQPQPQVAQGQAPPLVPLEPTLIVKAPDNEVEVISVRSGSAKRAAPRDQASTKVSNVPGLVRQHLPWWPSCLDRWCTEQC